MRYYFSILTFFLFFGAFAQEEVVENKAVLDSLYREDQFYMNFTFNNLINTPKGLSQNKFSPGIALGFLRDMPLNKSRTFAIAAGLGYSLNIYNDNLYQIHYDASNTNSYEIIDQDIYYKKNKLSLHFIDLPIEIRWRASTPESHKFWRIYTGFKFSYLIGNRYKFVNDIQTNIYKNNSDLNKLHYGCYLAAGWNTWNAYVYYGLNPLFKSAEISGEKIKMNTFNVGLQFYIL
jgi:hypothetical protein